MKGNMKQLLFAIAIFMPIFLFGQSQVEKWKVFELTLHGPSAGNPFTEVELNAIFTFNDNHIIAKGFYDGNGIYKIRFMPDNTGIWKYETQSNIPVLQGKIGEFRCIEPSGNNKGPVIVAEEYHFQYASGDPFYPVGTTLYCWELENYKETLESLRGSGYNKVRYMPFPHRGNKLPFIPFEGENNNWNFYKPNPDFWKLIDSSVMDLAKLGIQADFILFHPYDRGEFGLDKMNNEEKKFYLEYVVSRLSAYRNIWWSMANEYDLINKSNNYWNDLALLVADTDPHQHMHSIHCLPGSTYEWSQPWVTHVSYQISKDATELTDLHQFRTDYQKPIILDEYGYEGNSGAYWGKLSGEEELYRHWTATIQGIYATHGESWGPENYFWKGGTPVRNSFERISWLGKEIFENRDKQIPFGLSNVDMESAQSGDIYYLYYFGKGTLKGKTFYFPEGKKYQVDVIDSWNMTVEERGVYTGEFIINLSGNPYSVVRIYSVE
jgi:hypothetical protein